MKICHIVANLYAGGAQTFVVMLAIEQKKAGHDVTVILIDKFNHSPFELYLRDELHSHHVNCMSLERKPGKNLSIFKSLWRLHREIERIVPDIINSHLQITHLITALYLKAFGSANKLVLTIHSAPENWNKQTLFLNRHTPSVYCSLASQEKSIKRDCLQTVIDNGIRNPLAGSSADKMLGDFNIPAHHKLVLMVGNLSNAKNYPVAVEVASKFQDKAVSFLICGIQLETSERDLESFKTVNNIHYLGIKVPKDIYSLMAKCHCFLNTSIIEGLPITVLEALYIGTPCVLSPITAHYQLGEQMPYAYIAEDFEPFSFVSKIEVALALDLDKKAITESRREQLKRYSIENSAKRYVSFYKEVLAQ